MQLQAYERGCEMRKSLLSIVVALLILAPASPLAASVNSDVRTGSYRAAPSFYYYGDRSAPKDYFSNSLTAYVTVAGWSGWERRRLKMNAGSGDRWTTDTCVSNKGPLPSGGYDMDLFEKTWGHTTVRGWVWYLGDKKCPDGTWRTELFIHSQGVSGTADHRTNGCIEISQGARTSLKDRYRWSYRASDGRLYVST